MLDAERLSYQWTEVRLFTNAGADSLVPCHSRGTLVLSNIIGVIIWSAFDAVKTPHSVLIAQSLGRVCWVDTDVELVCARGHYRLSLVEWIGHKSKAIAVVYNDRACVPDAETSWCVVDVGSILRDA